MNRFRSLCVILFSAGLFGCDHATKAVAEHALGAGRVVTLVPQVLELRYARNPDVAFSALAGIELPHKAGILLAVSLVVLALTLAFWIRHRARQAGRWSLADTGFALVFAGALGNVVDRILRGYVIDFIHLSHWPIFNAADAFIVFGVIALGLSRSKERTAPA